MADPDNLISNMIANIRPSLIVSIVPSLISVAIFGLFITGFLVFLKGKRMVGVFVIIVATLTVIFLEILKYPFNVRV